MVEGLFFAVPRGCLQFVIVVFPDHTHLLFLLRWNLMLQEHNLDISHNKGKDNIIPDALSRA